MFAQRRDGADPPVFAEVADGLSLERPRLAEPRAAIAHGWIVVAPVTSPDRLTRDKGLLAAPTAEWLAIGVMVIVVGER